MSDVSRETQMPPDADLVASVFGGAAAKAIAYADLLADEGVTRGLIGPREVPRLWERHLFNCALIAPEVQGSTLCDVGSGAGLPGVVVALARPDLEVTLVEPLLRRTRFLDEVVERLELDNVRVLRDRAEEVARDPAERFDAVTARAVAPLERLVRWCLPLCRPGGELLALKGRTAAEELQGAQKVVKQLGGQIARVDELRRSPADDPTYVVRIESSGSPSRP